MPALITQLIDKRDNFELIRDQLAAILLTESLRQAELAEQAGQDPRKWLLRVFLERSNPWSEFAEAPDQQDGIPIVNVSYDGSTFDDAGSNLIERQKTVSTFNLDCLGYGVSTDATEPGAGHQPGDEAAALEAQRTARLVRNILMSAHYAYLGFPRGSSQIVWARKLRSIATFQPPIEARSVQHVEGARVTLEVTHNEFAPQVQPETLDVIAVTLRRAETGQVYFTAQFG